MSYWIGLVMMQIDVTVTIRISVEFKRNAINYTETPDYRMFLKKCRIQNIYFTKKGIGMRLFRHKDDCGQVW